MSAEKIISSWKQKKFKPLYWLQGEEDYYIDPVSYTHLDVYKRQSLGLRKAWNFSLKVD